MSDYANPNMLVSTDWVEKYKDVAVPQTVRKAVEKRFPKWIISKDVYLVTYKEGGSTSKKVYKLVLENSDKRMRVKVNDKGEFL